MKQLAALLLLLTMPGTALAQQKSTKSEKQRATPAPARPSASPAREAAVAAEPPSPEQSEDEAPVRMAARFFELLAKDEVDLAYAELTRGSKIAERPEEMRQLKAKTREAISVFGAVRGFEPVETKDVGTRLMRSTYLSLGKDFPLRWRFYFYRSEKVWRIVDLRVDDRIAGIFDEAPEPPATTAPPQ